MCTESINPDEDRYDHILDPMRLIKKNHSKMSKAMGLLQDVIDVGKKRDINKSIKDIIEDKKLWKQNDKYNFNDENLIAGINLSNARDMLRLFKKGSKKSIW